jgi:hypothetical protein
MTLLDLHPLFERLADAVADRVVLRIRQQVDTTRDAGRSPLLTTREAASLLRCSAQRLETARLRGDGPKFIKHGRSVRYRRADLEQYLDQHVRSNTSEGGDL